MENFTSCNILTLAKYEENFGACILINANDQPDCRTYFRCFANRSVDTYEQFQGCIEPTSTQVYAQTSFSNNTTPAYTVTVFSDSACTNIVFGPFDITFGCKTQVLSNSNGTLCNVDQLITPLYAPESAADTLHMFWDVFI